MPRLIDGASKIQPEYYIPPNCGKEGESPAEKVAGLFKKIKTWPVPANVNPEKKAKLMKMKAELMKCEIKILSALENHKM